MKGKAMHHGKMHRAKGGKVRVDEMEASEGGGDPEVEKEAEEKKHGGKVKKHHRAKGGMVEGHKPKHHMGKHVRGRKRGGRAGADKAPLSSANHTISGSGPTPKSEEGGLSK